MSGKLLAGFLVAVVLVVAGAAIVTIGPPGEERARQLDARRIDALRQLSQSARLYYGRHRRLPASVEEMRAEQGVALEARDPVTGAEYGYRGVDEKSFEVCATFDRASEDRAIEFWSHGAGRQCFTQKLEEPK